MTNHQKDRRSRWKIISLILLVAIGAPVLVFIKWYFFPALPEPVENQPLFQGVTYTRVVEVDTPLVYHIVRIDLRTAGLRFFATPEDDNAGYIYEARTTSAFLQEFDLQLAINDDFFDPWRDYGPLDYYPHSGDGVNVRGLTISDGEIVTAGYAPSDRFATLYITADNRASFTEPDAPIQTAISGNTMLLRSGVAADWPEAYARKRHPRTAVALSEDGNTLLLFIVDGRQPNYSRGVTIGELAEIILAHSGYDALNLDGGGSSSLVIENEINGATVLNSPIHTRVPGRQRPIANHLGIYALPLE